MEIQLSSGVLITSANILRIPSKAELRRRDTVSFPAFGREKKSNLKTSSHLKNFLLLQESSVAVFSIVFSYGWINHGKCPWWAGVKHWPLAALQGFGPNLLMPSAHTHTPVEICYVCDHASSLENPHFEEPCTLWVLLSQGKTRTHSYNLRNQGVSMWSSFCKQMQPCKTAVQKRKPWESRCHAEISFLGRAVEFGWGTQAEMVAAPVLASPGGITAATKPAPGAVPL